MDVIKSKAPAYRGRFAPSPTGALHLGSLLAATASYLQARHQQGEWQLRIEDIDPPREKTGSADQIIRTLEHFGFQWDGEIIYQGQRLDVYQHHLEELDKNNLLFACQCSRKEIAEQQSMQNMDVYPGTCRNKKIAVSRQHALRVIADNTDVQFNDVVQGPQTFNMQRDIGDFVIKRADGFYSYQLAVAVDDAIGGITEVVRGSDLLDSTPRQVYLQNLLGLTVPGYLHLPVLTDANGQKLSKQTYAETLNLVKVIDQLWLVLDLLGQSPPPELKSSSLDELWQWAIINWQADRIPRVSSIIFPVV